MLRSVRIQNFRGHVDTFVDFEKVTTLVGENGTGKTAILEAINFAMSPSFLANRIDEQDFNNEDIDNIDICLSFDPFEVIIQDGFNERPIPCDRVQLCVSRRKSGAAGKALSDPFRVDHYYVPDDSVTKIGDEKWIMLRGTGSDLNLTKFALSRPKSIAGLPRAFYFDKNRTMQIDVGYNTTLKKIADEFNWRFRKKLDDSAFREKIFDSWNKFYEQCFEGVDKKKFNITIGPIKERLGKITARDFSELELSFLNLENPFSKSFFSLRQGLNQVNHKGIGSGLSIVLSLVLLETISSLSKEDLLILIDEPELHLHPQLQKTTFAYLCQTDPQIVLSTHSENMIDIGEWKSIKRLASRVESDYGRIDVLPREEVLEQELTGDSGQYKVSDHLDDLSTYYHDKTVFYREASQLFFARCCLLTEGPTEKFGLERLATTLKFPMDTLTIVSCNGKSNLKFFQLLCIAFEIPYFTLFDLDDKPESSPENLEVVNLCQKPHYFAFTESFEHCFGTASSNHKASKTLKKIEDCSQSSIPQEISDMFAKLRAFIG